MESIPIPDKFPDGCRFGERSEGGFFVEFPDGKWFALSGDGKSLSPRPYLDRRGPTSEWWERSEAEMRKEIAALTAE